MADRADPAIPALPADLRPFEIVLDAAAIPMTLQDTEGRFLRVNARLEELVGRSATELIGTRWQDITHPDDIAPGERLLSEHRDGRNPAWRISKRYLRPDGETVWVVLNVSAIETGDRRFLFTQVVDVSDHMDVLRALRESEERFRTIFESGPIGIARVGADFRFTDVNEALASLLGYTPQELIGRTFVEITHPDDVHTDAELAKRLFAGEIPEYRIEKRYIRKDGSTAWVQLTATLVRDTDGTPVSGLAIIQDINERKDAERRIRENEQRLVQLLEGLPLGVFLTDPDGTPLYVNRVATELTGQGAVAEARLADLPRVYRAYIAGTDELYPVERLPIARALAGERTTADDIEIERPDGRRLMAAWGTPIFDDEGRVAYAAVVFADITEDRMTAASLQRALGAEQALTERLRRADEIKNAVLRMISHDLRSPLSIVTLAADLLERQGASMPEEKRAELIARVGAQARKADRMVRDLLDVDRLAKGEFDAERIDTDVRDLIEEVVRDLGSLGRSIRIECEPLTFPLDRAQIDRVLENLLLNAVRHTPEATAVTVRAARRGDALLLTVSDRGPGVPDALKERIFEPFVRGDPRHDAPGTGVGLSLVARFAALHGGRAWVEDNPGGGSAFHVLLPPS